MTQNEDRLLAASPTGRDRRPAEVLVVREGPTQEGRAAEDLEEALRHLDTR